MLERHLRLPAVIDATGLSRSTIYDKMRDGTFPQPVKLSMRAVAWSSDAVIQIDDSDDEVIPLDV